MRVSKVITKSGDGGQTGLGDGRRVSKTDIRIQAIGSMDYLNSLLGWAMVVARSPVKNDLERIQQDLFDLGGELAMPGIELQLLSAERLNWLEHETEKLNESLPPLKEFILPGGTELSARIHIVRTACRNTERDIVALAETKEDSDLHKIFLNRLSDYLFVLARKVQMDEGTNEIQWDH
ncbi:MAG: cob(I)yrinic acid a,c-diamide adenosyltransferase [Fidelibacterota bacterium]|jgi:cob(I)alamin adenosyltransferase|tara:strand:+ start:922 stop:1458 length:537 start_codon:yes stop_codon:yes gene_type:complete